MDYYRRCYEFTEMKAGKRLSIITWKITVVDCAGCRVAGENAGNELT
jgi:hypothetical protein